MAHLRTVGSFTTVYRLRPTSCTPESCPQLTHIDARLDGGFGSCALNGDLWLAPQQTFYFTGNFQRGLFGNLDGKICSKFLGFGQSRGRQI